MLFRKPLKVMELSGWQPASAPALLALVVALCLIAPPVAVAQVPGFLEGTVIEEKVEDDVDDAVADAAEDTVQESVEESVEEIIDELVLGPSAEAAAQEAVEEQVEDQVAEQVEDEAEQVAEEEVEETVEDSVEESVEEQVADTVTEQVEDDVEKNLEDTLEDTVEDSVEDTVEAAVEETVADSVEESVEENLEESVQEEVSGTVEQDVEEQVAETVEAEVETGVELDVESTVESAVESTLEVQVASVVEETLESEIDDILDDVESDLEVDEERIHREQWLVMAEPEVFEELAEEGYLFDTVTELPALGMRLAEVAGPSSFDITEVRRGVLDVVGKDRAEVDLNHIYTAGSELSEVENGLRPRDVMPMPAVAAVEALRIGMIDSRVDTDHPVLAHSHIESRDFVSARARMPDFHGTAIASIIAANSQDYQGLAPDAQVYAAGVFELDEDRGEIASTVSLLRALDWLMSSDVDVINISLAGPPNRLLETALSRAAEKEVVILAAAGNGGPVAQPMYPAAYDTVVAVTAVDAAHKVFRLANRGAYLDIAAPGVDLLHARAGGGFAASSGTSFAVPFAATAAASLIRTQPRADVMSLLYSSAQDLGPPGRDDIYGYGLLRMQGG